jgi:hypothetical protein
MPRPDLLAAALACALCGSAAARERSSPPAPSEPVTGFVALRAGAALPAGHARSRVSMDDLVAAAVPVGLELAARGGATELGLLVEYGRGFPPSCPARGACAASVVRAGIELLHRFSPGRGGSAWAGGGLGWEGTAVTLGGRTTRYDSLELLNLQLGRDFAVAGGLLVGPFVAATLAQAIEQDGKDIPQKSPHVWLQVGLRAELWP